MILKYKLQGKEVLIEDDDKELFENNKWYLVKARQLTEKYYVATFRNGKTLYLHRLIMDAKRGELIDHVNRNTLDCTRENLRSTTGNINRINCDVRKNKKSSLPKGVFIDKRKAKNPYYSMVQKSKDERFYLGNFPTPEEAEKAYKKKLKELYPMVA